MGPKKSDQQAQRDAATRAEAISLEQLNQSRADKARSNELMQPAIDFNKALSSGDMNAILPAIAQPLGQIATAHRAAKENVYNTVPPGPARDFALAQIERQAPAARATAINSAYNNSFDKLANIGSGLGAFSLQELGAGLRAGESGVQTRSGIMQQDAQGKAATLGFLGSLAGGAGAAAGGAFSRPRSSGMGNV